MAGCKRSPKHGMLKGKRPAVSKPFVKGEERTMACAKKGGQARREQCARFRSLKEAAIALRDIPAQDQKTFPGMSNGVAAIVSMYEAAQAGNPKAATFLASLLGEMVEKVDVQNLPIIRDDIPRAPDPQPAGKDEAQ